LKAKYRKFLIFLILAVAPASLAADRERVKELTQKLMCTCGGCNTTLGFCPHNVSCPNAVPMQADIVKMVDEGKDDKTILAAFVDQFGPSVLSTPTASGFNLSAWIVPFAALFIGAFMVVYLGRRFRHRWSAPSAATTPESAKYQQEIEEELEKYVPED
jgi:cytochrome c-type biogenesis protein CcmH/NrfF